MLSLAIFLVLFSGSHLLPSLSAVSDCSGPSSENASSTGRPIVALIDQLASQYPNPSFGQNISESARDAGFGFVYLTPANTTLSFLLNLPNYGYSILIFRTHGAQLVATDPAAIVTSSKYSQSERFFDQLTGSVVASEVNGSAYFALEPSFIMNDMCGRFSGTIVLTMFCWGAKYNQMATAFLGKGASAYVGWDNPVTVIHTDFVFQSLVKLLLEGKPLSWAVDNAMMRFGPDQYHARLVNYSILSASASPAWWDQYWYTVSAGTVAIIFGLVKVRNAPTSRVRH